METGGVSLTNNGGSLTIDGSDDIFFNDASLINAGGTTSFSAQDDFRLEANSSLEVTGGTLNIDPAAEFTTEGTSGNEVSIEVSGGGALNIDLTATGGTGNTFDLDVDDTLSVDGSTSSATISVESNTPVNLDGTVSLTNEGILTVNSGTTFLDSGTKLEGGTSGEAGTLRIVDGDLSVNEPLLSGEPNIEMNVSGSQELTAPNAGSSIINLGTFEKSGTGDVTLNTDINNIQAEEINISAGTLINGADDQIANTTNMEIAAGGTWNTGGFDEIVNTLTLSGDGIAVLDMSNGDSIIEFANSSGENWSPDTVLYIDNWSGDRVNGGGTDPLIFNNMGLNSGQFSQVFFRNPAGVAGPGLYEAKWIGDELVPVPEPGTSLGGLLLVGALGYLERRRLRTWLNSLRNRIRN